MLFFCQMMPSESAAYYTLELQPAAGALSSNGTCAMVWSVTARPLPLLLTLKVHHVDLFTSAAYLVGG